jgi:predicted TIM-barrel fold metal-dependent hydrolase
LPANALHEKSGTWKKFQTKVTGGLMKFDMHLHVVGRGRDISQVDQNVYFYPDDNNLFFTRILYSLVEKDLEKLGADMDQSGAVGTEEYLKLIDEFLRTSEEIDAVVLLGLDAVFDPKSGKFDKKRTDLWVSNRFLSKTVKELNGRLSGAEGPQTRGKRFFYGGSVNPNRRDWREELEFVIGDPDAVLVKIIPSAQHIHLRDPKHKPFYAFLAEHRMPLLCHVGPEYSFPEGIREWRLDQFRHLDRALERGVTVIAAHCATPVFPPPINKNEVKEFHAFMKSANPGKKVQLWGDTSAFSLSTRIPIVQEVLESFPAKWLVNGSDFPIPIDGWIHLPWVTPGVTMEDYLKIKKTRNPLDRDVRIKRAHGFSDTILENAEKVLRLPT